MSSRKRLARYSKQQGDNKKIKNALKLEIDGIKFKSRLEAFCYDHLKKEGIKDFTYEENRFTLQEGFNFPNSCVELYNYTESDEAGNKYKKSAFGEVTSNIRPITYTPDFCCIRDDKTGYIIETKGFKTDSFTLKWKMFKLWLTNNGYKLSLYAPNNQQNVIKCIQSIKSRYYL